MKVVDLQELCELPIGVIFSSYEPCIVSGLFKREEVIWPKAGGCPDFFFQRLLADPKPETAHATDDKVIEFHDLASGERWGNFDATELFVVYDDEDITAMIKALRP